MPEATPADKLAEQYMPFARKLARSLHARLPGSDRGDLEGDAFLGLVRAANRFDAGHGAKFAAFAAPAILGAMLDGIRREGRQVKTVSFHRESRQDGSASSVGEWMIDRKADDPVTVAELRDEVDFVLSNLRMEKHSRPGSPRLGGKAIAEEAGITSGGASQRISRARRIMDEMLREAAANN